MTNYKFITSTNKNKILPSNYGYSEKIKAALPFFSDDFYQNTNPIIAGSFILRNVFSYNAPYEDIDLYFTTEGQRDYTNKYLYYIGNIQTDTNFATTYLIGTRMKIQVIKKIYSSQLDVISNFDLTPAMICYQPKFNSFTYEMSCLYAWYNKNIKLNISPLFEIEEISESNCQSFFLYFNLLTRRLNKYSERYQMTIDPQLIDLLNEAQQKLTQFTSQYSWAFRYFIQDSSGAQRQINVNSSNIEQYTSSLLDFTNENLLPG